ncbi:MAG: EVE domain-containing protein [Bacteroidales bacterium]|nr:EVE domain-containing protein [Bacteroidales bacterium]MCI2133699.1 EVE domain-containing protein [Bacteroidales bacterium]
MSAIEKYLHEFVSLNTAKVSGHQAPHKAVLLLAIMDLIADGTIDSNHIVLSEELVSRFDQLWKEYVSPDAPFQPKVATPYWHLQNEPFYHLFFNDGTKATDIDNPYKVQKLRHIVFATLDEELFGLIQNEDTREELATALIINYLDDIQEEFDSSECKSCDYWIVASNATYFHIDDCIREVGHVYWRQYINAAVGDKVYLYGTRPESRIKYLMEVMDVDMPFSENMNDEKYWDSSQTYEVRKKYNRFMKLEFRKKITTPRLALSELLKHGLKAAPQSPVRISQPAYAELLDYIKTNE